MSTSDQNGKTPKPDWFAERDNIHRRQTPAASAVHNSAAR